MQVVLLSVCSSCIKGRVESVTYRRFKVQCWLSYAMHPCTSRMNSKTVWGVQSTLSLWYAVYRLHLVSKGDLQKALSTFLSLNPNIHLVPLTTLAHLVVLYVQVCFILVCCMHTVCVCVCVCVLWCCSMVVRVWWVQHGTLYSELVLVGRVNVINAWHMRAQGVNYSTHFVCVCVCMCVC